MILAVADLPQARWHRALMVTLGDDPASLQEEEDALLMVSEANGLSREDIRQTILLRRPARQVFYARLAKQSKQKGRFAGL